MGLASPDFSTPCDMRVFPHDTGNSTFPENGHFSCVVWDKELKVGEKLMGTDPSLQFLLKSAVSAVF